VRSARPLGTPGEALAQALEALERFLAEPGVSEAVASRRRLPATEAVHASFPEWLDPRLVVLVLNNGDLNQVTWEQRVMAGDPKFEESQTVPRFPYAKYAQMLGLVGLRVDTPEALGSAWDTVLNADRPALLEVITDPSVPPLPPHTTLEQAQAFVSSLLHGDPERSRMIKSTARQLLDTLTAGTSGQRREGKHREGENKVTGRPPHPRERK
jgi:hypothetical protein